MSSKKLSPGRKFGQWTLHENIGEGGNGVVWDAVDSEGDRGAIKFIKSHHLVPDENGQRSVRLQRFIDEITFLNSRAGTPGIIRVLDFSCPADPNESDRPWFVMPIGDELRDAISQSPNKLETALSAIAEVARCLAGLHGNGVFHRDIKPENILQIDGSFVLSDFGLVQFPEKGAVTGGDEFMGPLFYVTEMMANSNVADPAKADVYSLAKTLWVVATGQRYPLPGEQRVEVSALTLSAYVDNPRCRTLDALLDVATRHDASSRPTMLQFADEVSAWLHPTIATESSIVTSLDDIARTYRPAMDVVQSKQRLSEQRDAALDALWTEASKKIEPHFRAVDTMRLRGSTGVIVAATQYATDNEPHHWYDWLAAPRPLGHTVRRVKSVFIVQQLPGLEGRSVAYCGGIRFSPGENGTARITAAHAFGSINSDSGQFSDCSWTKEIEVQVCLPTAVRDLDDLLTEFALRLPEGIGGMLKLFEKIGHLRPPR